MLIEISKKIPDGWRLYKLDATIDGNFCLWLARNKLGYAEWAALPEVTRDIVDLYATGQATTLTVAFDDAIAKAKASHTLPLIEVGS